jgi:spore coat polysaccharide biosynthesis predicted glycosyltransferase SpsG
MLYYYANSGHKIGLERVRRGAALLKRLASSGVETQLLVNDFRAGLAAKELGVKEYVTVETVQDIDAIAQFGDSIIIDSPEDDHGRLVKYCEDFKNVWRFEVGNDDVSVHGEMLFKVECKDESCEDAVIIDDDYFEETAKEERTLFFLSDADYDKTILSNEAFFKTLNMELLLGNYFFVKYEDDLAKLFSTLHEPEDYMDLIKSSSHIVTASAQTALEAKVSGAKVIYLHLPNNDLYPVDRLKTFGIEIVNGFDTKEVAKYLENETKTPSTTVKPFNEQNIISSL